MQNLQSQPIEAIYSHSHWNGASLWGRQQIGQGREAADLVFVRHSKAPKPPAAPCWGSVAPEDHMAVWAHQFTSAFLSAMFGLDK